jgi:flagellar hook-basal body complex protein FliE
MPIDPSFAISGSEFRIDGLGGVDTSTGPDVSGTSGTSGAGFGDMLGKSLQSLADSQTDASAAAQSLADGSATDPTAVVMAVERAQLAMQLASQIRTKAVEAVQDVFHTQV